VSEKNPDVPHEVEDYLIAIMVNAGRIGGAVGGPGGERGGAKGAERAARRMRTTSVERHGEVALAAAEIIRICQSAFDDARPLSVEPARFVVPIGRTGLQQVVVEIGTEQLTDNRTRVATRAFAKEGRLSRHPAERTLDRLWAVLPQAS
jgi:hypothetical protein